MDKIWEIVDNLKSLGPRRLLALGVAFASVISLLGISGFYLSRPSLETLYAGLDREDVTRIGSVLKSEGIPFDISQDGTTVSVRYGQTAQARMLLAERGLPQSANAGYELFDKVGALGLTSFMQEVTRVRALEGELARTIQLIRGVKAARVHIVMPDEGSFRRAKQPPSASVVIRTEGPDDSSAAQAIRHLVAASLPGMSVDQVTVLNTDGMILVSSDGEAGDGVPLKALALEKSLSKEIQDNIRKTLTPYLNLANFQVSVRARVNTDRRQTSETVYDPESKVERSVRTVKENSTSQNATSSSSTSVERNVPQDRNPPADGKQSSDETKKTEELTNFEMSTKTVNTTSGGYNIENLAIAVVVNKASLAKNASDAQDGQAEKALTEIEALVASAAGYKKERGDTLKVTAVEFNANDHELAPVEPMGLLDHMGRHLGTMVNALTVLAVTALLIFFGVRPAIRALSANLSGEATTEIPQMLGVDPSLQAQGGDASQFAFPSVRGPMPSLGELEPPTPRQRLEQLIDQDERQAAEVLKQWLHMRETS